MSYCWTICINVVCFFFSHLNITFLNLIITYCLLLHFSVLLCHPISPSIYIVFVLFPRKHLCFQNYYLCSYIYWRFRFFFKGIEGIVCCSSTQREFLWLFFLSQTIKSSSFNFSCPADCLSLWMHIFPNVKFLIDSY